MKTEAVFVVIWVVCALIGAAIGQSKGKAGLGFILGLLLGVIGIFIISVVNKATPEKRAVGAGAIPAGFAPPNQAPGGWWPDPMRRHEYRYFDGTQWTDHVSDRGVQGTDPLLHLDHPAA